MCGKDVGAWVGIFWNSIVYWNLAVLFLFFPLFHPQHKRRELCYQSPNTPIVLRWHIVVYVSNELGFNIIWPSVPFISCNKTNLNQHSYIFIHLGYLSVCGGNFSLFNLCFFFILVIHFQYLLWASQ